MEYMVIQGLKPYDGRYPAGEITGLTVREWGWVKRLTGYTPSMLDDNSLSDPELSAVLAIIILRRAGRIDTTEVQAVWETFQDAENATIDLVFEPDPNQDPDAADDAGPPSTNWNGRPVSPGPNSKTSSGTSEPLTLPAFGTPESDTSAFVPPTSVT